MVKAVTCVWGVGAGDAAARIREYCAALGWDLVEEVTKAGVGDGTLGWMLGAAERKAPERLILTREGLADLEREFPDLWEGDRAWLEERGVCVVAL